VLVDGVDVNKSLVRAGLAWQYPDGPQDPRVTEAEKTARATRAGLWADADPIPPWRWRRPARQQSPQSLGGHPEATAGPFHGNVRSGVFHRPGCSNYSCKNCTMVFASVDAALSAGYRPSADCMR
jgi:hypothetical protein